MEPKKHPKADLNRNSGLYFMIGLALSLCLTWVALEYKSVNKTKEIVIKHEVLSDINEDVPITKEIKVQPPPPPPSAPTVIEIIEDVEEIEETLIGTTETDQDAQIEDVVVSLDEVEVEEVEEDIVVPFAVIEEVPVFPGCEQASKADKRLCFQKKVQEHVAKNFRYPAAALEMGIQGKVFVQFIIDSDGQVNNIRMRGPDRLLEAEAERLIASLPRMIPGKQRGRPVKVPYSIPVTFKLM